jgi:hypothetical protein
MICNYCLETTDNYWEGLGNTPAISLTLKEPMCITCFFIILPYDVPSGEWKRGGKTYIVPNKV